ncbi:MAG TPA: DUF5655 domain-containing protein, partial [Fimbriimonas sp.]|nr:DUF5655 domain-containing protein [Fimbriimonas sp.]
MDLDKAIQTQLDNIQKKTGKTLAELDATLKATGLTKHTELLNWAKTNLGIGHGDANTLIIMLKRMAEPKPEGEVNPLDEIYAGPKAPLRPIHEKLMAEISTWGEFEIAPKKGYVSLRRKKQFAMIGPATNSRVEVGLNMKGVDPTDRLEQRPAGEMCQYKVKVTDDSQVDAE